MTTLIALVLTAVPTAHAHPGHGADDFVDTMRDRIGFEDALSVDNDEAVGDMADALRLVGDDDGACALYDHALGLDPNDSEWIGRVANCPQGTARLRDIASRMDDDEAIGDLGDVFAEVGDADAACEQYARALSIDPMDREWIGNVFECPGGDGIVRASAVASGDDEMIGDFGDYLSNNGDMDAACDAWRTALSFDSADSEWQNKVAVCEAFAGDFATLLSHEDDEFLGDVADVFASGGRTNEACTLYARAHELDPGDSEWVGNLVECPDHLGAMVEMAQASSNDELVGDVADAVAERGDAETACALYERAARIDADDSEWQAALGECTAGG